MRLPRLDQLIYCRLPEWGYGHQTVNPGAGEYARDEDGDEFQMLIRKVPVR